MEAPFKAKDTADIQIEPIEVDSYARERELMQAAINEVLEERYGDEMEPRENEESDDVNIGSFFAKTSHE